jgi:DNA-binding GntR family transcriptional regulator
MAGKSKYYEIKEQIEAKILEGEYPLGSQLPSEPELAEFFIASRGTVRQTLSALARDAVIARRSGAGTFVIRKPKEAQVKSFTQQVKEAGMVPSTKILTKEKIMASEAGWRISEAFLLSPEVAVHTPVYCIDRLRCGDDEPLALQTLYLLAEQFKPNLLETEDFSGSIFAIYARYHREVTWADEIIRARLASPVELNLLKMQNVSPAQQFVYVRERISYDQENIAVEVMTSVDRGDFFRDYRYRIVEGGHRLGPQEET